MSGRDRGIGLGHDLGPWNPKPPFRVAKRIPYIRLSANFSIFYSFTLLNVFITMMKRGIFMDSLIFDYYSYGQNLDIPIEVIQKYEKEAQAEFPFDKMMMEINVIRAIRSYAKLNNRMSSFGN